MIVNCNNENNNIIKTVYIERGQDPNEPHSGVDTILVYIRPRLTTNV